MLYKSSRSARAVLLFSTFVISICGLSYELLMGSLSTNLEGNPVLQYSLTIGFFMSALGIGSYISRFVTGNLLLKFIAIEIILGCLGGVSVPLLNLVYVKAYEIYTPANILLLTAVGTFVGLEIPLIVRILEEEDELKETISNVLTIDYIGGLAASLIFPLLLYPYVGLLKTAFLIGLVNVFVGVVNLVLFRRDLPFANRASLWGFSLVGALLLSMGAWQSSWLTGYFSRAIYGAVLFQEQTKFQKIMLTRFKGDLRLYLDGHLQFSGVHEYRYHESLIMPPFYLKKDVKSALVMGGGDGLAIRQLLKFKSLEKIVLVDLDKRITDLAQGFSAMRRLNGDALNHPKVQVLNMDAYTFLKNHKQSFDVIYADFPDPHDAVISRLYSREFYHFVKNSLTPGGIFVTQASSPLHARLAFRCIEKTMASVFPKTLPFLVSLPNLEEWGFIMASRDSIDLRGAIRGADMSLPVDVPLRFFTKGVFQSSLTFPPDTELKPGEDIGINLFVEPVVYRYYLGAWKYF